MGDGQTGVFAAGEGDRYFERNRSYVFDPARDPLTTLVADAGLRPAAVAEVGAAQGDRLAAFVARHGCRAMAVEPSAAAVDEGRRRHPEVEFRVGTMDALPVPAGETFDLVVVNFVLHWVGREDLLRSVAEIDRLVADGGYLGVGDFLPTGLVKSPYHHRPGLWTYKQDYADVFVASGLYVRVASVAGRYGGPIPAGDVAPGERVGYTLLHKSLAGHYLPVDHAG